MVAGDVLDVLFGPVVRGHGWSVSGPVEVGVFGHDLCPGSDGRREVWVLASAGRDLEVVWLPGLDSNQGLQLQRLTCCRYTIGQGLRACGGGGWSSCFSHCVVLEWGRQGSLVTEPNRMVTSGLMAS